MTGCKVLPGSLRLLLLKEACEGGIRLPSTIPPMARSTALSLESALSEKPADGHPATMANAMSAGFKTGILAKARINPRESDSRFRGNDIGVLK